MASISTYRGKKGTYRAIQFVAADGKRKSIRLGKISERNAVTIKGHVEELNNASIYQQAPARRTAEWIADLDDTLAGKLAAVGLIPKRKEPITTLLGPFLDLYVSRRIDTKPATREVWGQVVRNLKDHFGVARNVASINEGHAEGFKLYLIGEKLAPTTVSKRLQFARQFFRAAKKQGAIASNPFLEVSSAAVIDKERQHYVSLADTEALLAVANPTWKTIIALCRFAGLRSPSEVLSLRWQAVDWAESRMEVDSPKTEHHPGHASRVVPIFAPLYPYLREAFEAARDGAVYVIDTDHRQAADTPRGWRSCNLRTEFGRIIKRAKLEAWPRLFHALRSSCETDLTREFPLHVVCQWLGNTPKIAMKHYLLATEDDFKRASQKSGAESGAENARNGGNKQPEPETHTEESAGISGSCSLLPLNDSSKCGEDRIRTCGRI